MKKLFNDGWEFSLQPLDTTREELEEKDGIYKPVGLPHDWLIYDTDNLYQDGMGWYRKRFTWEGDTSKRASLRFDGIYMDSTVYVNGRKAKEWKYGYSAFDVELTSFLTPGENEIQVSVRYQAPNSRWYSGAGIFRDVWMTVTDSIYIPGDGIYFHAREKENDDWNISVETEVVGGSAEVVCELSKEGSLEWTTLLGEISSVEAKLADGTPCIKYVQKALAAHPKRWDLETPECYILKVTLKREGRILQCIEQRVGFRTMEFSPHLGFLLNGRKVKLNGVCEHHDLGCLGAAYHSQAMRRKLRILKEMGVNAIRLTHNMHAADVLDLADEMGLLMVSEAFDMWERPKTTYDYARFFPEWYPLDVASWVRRDRNHASLIMWSIGNEIYDTHIDGKGLDWTKILMEEVKKHDPLENGAVTIGSNYMPWENAQKCADLVKIAGYNYGEKYYEDHHEKHPDWIIYGSETSSTVQSRGIYHFPYQQSVLADEDEQCSSLGNSVTSWGARSTEACILAERDHPFSCGQFLWTGTDYIGEPTPYHTRNSYFGQVDTAGFPKDSYYIYQAEWTDYRKNPMVHIFPYWDFNEGQCIDVRVCSNAPVVELYFDGKSQGTFTIDHSHGTDLVAHWQLPYKAGEIKAVACDEAGKIVAQEVRHSFGEAAKICLKPEVKELRANGSDLLFLEVSAEDEKGFPVENANNRVNIRVSGAGQLVGTDNGDSTENDGYKSASRRLFSGKLLVVVKADIHPGELKINVQSEGLPEAELILPVIQAEVPEGIGRLAYLAGKNEGSLNAEIPVRNIRLESERGLHLYPENKETRVRAYLCPEHATDTQVTWCIVDDAGIVSTLAEIEPDGLQVNIRAKSDGQFRLRCMSKCGTDKIRIISQLEFAVSGLGKAFKNPYEFVSAGLFDESFGEIGNGNDHGVATARDGESGVGFRDIDFGSYGSDRITLPIFALTDEVYEIRIYEGIYGEEDAKQIASVNYQKPSVWNTYQEETYQLNKRLSGIAKISFVLNKKVHLKGFLFEKQNRAWQQLCAAECDKVYGDSFVRGAEQIKGIGNNVTIEFHEMDFGDEGTGRITVCGNTPLEKNTIILRLEGAEEERRILEFVDGQEEQTFAFEKVWGVRHVSFVFLPGSDFDFHWFQFEK